MKNLKTFESHLDEQYGKRGTDSREQYEEEFEAFKLGVVLQELRKEHKMTQEQLAQKCGTTTMNWHQVNVKDYGQLTEVSVPPSDTQWLLMKIVNTLLHQLTQELVHQLQLSHQPYLQHLQAPQHPLQL